MSVVMSIESIRQTDASSLFLYHVKTQNFKKIAISLRVCAVLLVWFADLCIGYASGNIDLPIYQNKSMMIRQITR